MASARIQLLPLIAAAERLNFIHRIYSIDVDNPDCINHLGIPSVCFIGKINHHDDDRFNGFALSILACIARLKALSVPICIIYCDHLAVSQCVRGRFYRDILRLADFCVVPCLAMKKLVSNYFDNSNIYIIEDPIQVTRQDYPSLKSNSPFHIGWFGSINNVHHASNHLGVLMNSITSPPSIKFSVLTNQRGLDILSNSFNYFQSSLKLPIPWVFEPHIWIEKKHPHLLESFLAPLHLVWIPSDPTNVVKQAVSHNRVVDSIQSGCIVVANKMASYQELSSVSLLSSDYSAVINSVYSQYDRLSRKHASLRDSVLSRFQPSLNNQKWESLLLSIC